MSNPLAILAGRYPRAGISQPVDFSRFTAAWPECCYASASCRAQADPADCVVAFDSPRKGGIEPNRSHALSRGHEPTRVASIQLPSVERTQPCTSCIDDAATVSLSCCSTEASAWADTRISLTCCRCLVRALPCPCSSTKLSVVKMGLLQRPRRMLLVDVHALLEAAPGQ